MKNNTLEYFKEISKIPRESGNEKNIAEYIYSLAKKRGLFAFKDDFNNVIVKKDNGKKRSVILQAHIDMVAEKNEDRVHDFTKDPIEIIDDGKFLKANGTTLGADNGIGVSYMLSLLDEDLGADLELLFTSDEEVGMTGAREVDMNMLSGNAMINLDSEEEGVIIAACAGGARINVMLSTNENAASDHLNYTLNIKGLLGGHSGTDIDKGIYTSFEVFLRLYNEIKEKVKVSSIDVLGKSNALSREAVIKLLIKEDGILFVQDAIEELKESLNISGLDINLMKDSASSFSYIENFDDIMGTLSKIPRGVIRYNEKIKEKVETSCNIGRVKKNSDHIEINILARSSSEDDIYKISQEIFGLATLKGSVKIVESYPAWEYKNDSELRDVAKRTWEKLYGSEPVIDIIHAGLECAIFSKKKDLDIISIGPNIYGAHSPDERVEIESINRVYEFLVNIINNIS